MKGLLNDNSVLCGCSEKCGWWMELWETFDNLIVKVKGGSC